MNALSGPIYLSTEILFRKSVEVDNIKEIGHDLLFLVDLDSHISGYIF